MKIAFVLSHELYLRNFATVIRGLADKGHDVSLAFTALRDPNDRGLAEFVDASSNIRLVEPPGLNGWWRPVTDLLRATRDFVHSLDPAFDEAPKIRARIAARVPGAVRWPVRAVGRLPLGRKFLDHLLQWIEWSIPCDRSAVSWLRESGADALVISPLIDMNYAQFDLLKAARLLGLPGIYPVASWDNLTMKGRVQIKPDGVVVWNRIQIGEAERLHGMDPAKVVAAGAQLYDQWFVMKPDRSRAEFCAAAGGLDPDRPILLYTGSSPYICPDERAFFERWLDRLRSDPDPILRSANVLVRPHPLHAAQWRGLEPGEALEGRLAVWPEDGEMPITAEQMQRYFDNLWHADALVGINTSAFLEAGILGKRTFTLRDDAFRDTQEGTLHFAYVAESGLLGIANDFDSHFRDLSQELSKPRTARGERLPFIAEFLRPNGIDEPAVPQVVEALEKFARTTTGPRHHARFAWLGRLALWPVAALIIRPVYFRRAAKKRTNG